MTARLSIIVTLTAALFFAATVPTRAQEGSVTSYLTPFPPNDVHKVLIVGDDLASGLLWGMVEAFTGDVRLDIVKRHRQFNTLTRSDFDDRLAGLDEDLAREAPTVAIVMLGAYDRAPSRASGGKRAQFGTDAWRADLASRADKMMKAFKKRGIAVYWVGLPNARRPEQDEDFKLINDILRERVYINNFKFIDAYSSFVDEAQGGWSAYGPDQAGKMVLLRENDGISFTSAGNRKLAFFVERELKRDLTQAKADRNVPLAGSEPEQAKIHPVASAASDAKPGTDASASAGTNFAVAKPDAAGVPAPGAQSSRPEGGPSQAPPPISIPADLPPPTDQRSDNGKISLKLVNQTGREEVVTLDVLRPAIPATVVQLVTRRESPDRPSQMGEQLVDQITGGLTVMSSVTPSSLASASGGARRLSPTQSPYYRVLMKGERLASRRGRADDFSWPRPEGPITRSQQPAAASDSSAGPKATTRAP